MTRQMTRTCVSRVRLSTAENRHKIQVTRVFVPTTTENSMLFLNEGTHLIYTPVLLIMDLCMHLEVHVLKYRYCVIGFQNVVSYILVSNGKMLP
jgi:hypothetical protein